MTLRQMRNELSVAGSVKCADGWSIFGWVDPGDAAPNLVPVELLAMQGRGPVSQGPERLWGYSLQRASKSPQVAGNLVVS